MKLQEIVLEDKALERYLDSKSKTAAYVKSMLEAYDSALVNAVRECSTALKELKTPMYRGDSSDTDFVYREGVKEKRTSQTGTNSLMNLLDSTLLKDGAPRRSFSTFGTMSVSHANIFGSRFLMFPANSVRKFVSSTMDINLSGSPIHDAFSAFTELASTFKSALGRQNAAAPIEKVESILKSKGFSELSKEDQNATKTILEALKFFDEVIKNIVRLDLETIDKKRFLELVNYCKHIEPTLVRNSELLLKFTRRINELETGELSANNYRNATLIDQLYELTSFPNEVSNFVSDIPKIQKVFSGEHGLKKHNDLSSLSKTDQEVWFEGPYMLIKLYPFVDYTVLRTQLLNLKPRQ